MKIGDVITCCAPNDAIVTGTVVLVEPTKTRSGCWNVAILPTNFGEWTRYVIRPEDEGTTWIYGDDEKAKRALEVARALADRTQVSPGRLVYRRRKKGTV